MGSVTSIYKLRYGNVKYSGCFAIVTYIVQLVVLCCHDAYGYFLCEGF
jgi:hypothetical protein